MGYHLPDAVAERIYELRVARGWSQKHLAKEARLSKDTISHMERGAHGARLDTLERIAEALGLTLIQLVDVEEMLSSSRADERRARLLRQSLAQLPPWLSEAMSTALRVILRAARE